MQKKLIAIAIAAALAPAAAMADATVYGRVHLSVDSYSGNAGDTTTGTQNGLNLTSNSSRLGFKGSESLAGGLTGVFQIETGINAGTSTQFGDARDTYLGVAGGFGTVIAGRLPLANQWAYDANFFGDKVGDAATFARGGFGGNGLLAVPGRVDRAIAYVSPSLGGVTVLAAFVPNTQQSLGMSQASANKQSSYTLRASYDSNGIFAAGSLASIGVAGVEISDGSTAGVPANLGAITAAKDGKVTITSLAGGYDFGMGNVRGQWVQSKADAAAATAEVKQTVLLVGGKIKLSDDDSVSVQFAKAGDLSLAGSTVTDTGGSLMAVGFDHSMSKDTTVYAAFAKASNKTASAFDVANFGHGGVGAPAVNKSPSAISVGMARNF